MRSVSNLKWTFFLAAILLGLNAVIVLAGDGADDEDNPEVTNRVARINFINGNAQIKRTGSEDWEPASLNLPLVEGDEITTESNSAMDIQFDSQNILHLAESSFLKITTLRDDGVSVSISEGKLSLRVFSFNKDQTFFEIDAPQITVSVQTAGLYRVDVGDSKLGEVRVTSTMGGEARVLSDNSELTLRDGKSAKIFTGGTRLGDHETSDAAPLADEWDKWVATRDEAFAKLIDSADYDKYYDRDIYGAEDLNNYGQWRSSDEYGWVWQPYNTSIASYQNWTPYRYGRWSWVSPYGWTWVNDEPWGWATYHYGRWVFENNGWAWTPYPYNRPSRSWWRPAIVTMVNVGDDICWYPAPYNKKYHDYNRKYRDKNVDRRNIIHSSRSVGANQPQWAHRRDKKDFDRKDRRDVPSNAVVSVKSDWFGRRGNHAGNLSNQTAGQILAKDNDNWKKSPRLPNFKDRQQDFKRSEPRPNIIDVNTGAAPRQAGVELNKQFENRRNRDGRTGDNSRQRPVRIKGATVVNPQQNTGSGEVNNQNSTTENQNPQNNSRSRSRNNDSDTRKGDSSDRRNRDWEQRRNSNGQNTVPAPQQNNSSGDADRSNRQRNRDDENRRNNSSRDSNESSRPPRQEQPRQEQPRREERQERRSEPSRSEPRQERSSEPRREQPRQEQPRQEQPRQEPRREEPRREEPRREQPRQETPRSEPRNEKPAEPKQEPSQVKVKDT